MGSVNHKELTKSGNGRGHASDKAAASSPIYKKSDSELGGGAEGAGESPMEGVVVSVHKTGYSVRVEQAGKGELHFCITNNSYKASEMPVVNDTVVLMPQLDQFIITDIRPRRNFVARYDFYKDREQVFAANIDTAFVVTSANREFSANRVKRFLALLEGQDIRRVIVLTKTDLCADIEFYRNKLATELGDTQSAGINCNDAHAVLGLLDFVKPNGTALLLGSSGVGKSTIINSLCGMSLKTNAVQGEKHGNKGKHTTSARSLYQLADGRKIIDNPGIRIVGVRDEYEETLRTKQRIKRR